jgi:hypothetical protein
LTKSSKKAILVPVANSTGRGRENSCVIAP